MTFGNKFTAIRPFAVISLLALSGLTGCAQVYDDTKGWGNDVEAWFRRDVIQGIKTSFENINEEPAESPGTAVAEGTDTPQPTAGSKMAGKPMPSAAGSTPVMASEAAMKAEEIKLASTASELPAAAPKAAATESQHSSTTGHSAPAQGAAENLYPQTAGKPAPEPVAATDAAKAVKPQQARAKAAAMALHLSSNKTKNAAQREWTQLKSAFPDQLGALNLEVVRTDLGKKGIFYRVMAGPFADKPSAAQICSELKKKDQYCAVMSAPKSQSQAKTAQSRAPS